VVQAQDSCPVEKPPVIPGYVLEGKIGEGGMGEVHRAIQLSLQRTVAVKFLNPLCGESGAAGAFEREARLMAALAHPNVVTIYDCGQEQGRHFLVMECLEGSTLRSRLEPGCPLPRIESASVLDAIAQALCYIHEKGILHLDLKPENVLFTTGSAIKITDFGLASHLNAPARTETSPCQGTLDYCSPEQSHGLPVDKRSDVFSLATMAYELLTGHLPSRVNVPATERNPRLPRAVDEVLRRGLARDPDERTTTVEEFRQGLLRALGVSAHRSGRRPLLMVAAWCLVALSLAIFFRSRATNQGGDAVDDPRQANLDSFLRPAVFPGKDEMIFPCLLVGQSNFYLLWPDGRQPVRLTEGDDRNLLPAYSPDGRTIAFTSDRDGNYEIYRMNADGSQVRRLTRNGGGNRAPTWSPDGLHIAFDSDRDGNHEIYVMDADGSNPINLTKHPGYDADPAWSPDGRRIAFASERARNGFRVFVMDADGKNVRDLSQKDNPMGYVYPAWSPDGKQIVYAEAVKSALEIFVSDVDGTSKKQLTRLGGANSLAAWSPDGQQIFFVHSRNDDDIGSLYVMDADGSNPTLILKNGGSRDGARPTWRKK
jgi:Tol biopolymer transport system component